MIITAGLSAGKHAPTLANRVGEYLEVDSEGFIWIGQSGKYILSPHYCMLFVNAPTSSKGPMLFNLFS
ncbi:MAG TPA: hypothetical protein VFN35_16930, partial [Ktedonobacteraceae bacterium]|nr:hypothetical protein [Ktedonobacteraceae bacterium]